MIRISNIKIPLDYDDSALEKAAAKELKIGRKAIKSVSLFRRSVDARKKEQLHFTCSIDVKLLVNEDKILKRNKSAVKATPYRYELPEWKGGAAPVIVGFGPAGMFAALVLAQSGANPIVVERGRDVDSRTADVNRFWLSGKLDESSNVQFGEGGAGTFSDGKLNTGTKDARQRKVLEEFVAHGAPEEILVERTERRAEASGDELLQESRQDDRDQPEHPPACKEGGRREKKGRLHDD